MQTRSHDAAAHDADDCENRIRNLILGSSQRLEPFGKIVGTQGVKNSTIMNPYGGESVEASEVQALQKIES